MLYHVYDMQKKLFNQASKLAQFNSNYLINPLSPFSYTHVGKVAAAALDVFAHSSRHYGKPEFNLPLTIIDGKTVTIKEEIIAERSFCNLLHFKRNVKGRNDPKLLIVAPMSGHFATLLRGTVERLLPGHEVYITDWIDAKEVPSEIGRFDLDDYIDYVIDFIRILGPDLHLLAVCQPSVPSYAAVCQLNAIDDPATPSSLTMMGGPIDTRKSPTAVNSVAKDRPISWFAKNVIASVPFYYPGANRRIYPGFLQLGGFISMNLSNHLMSHWNMFEHLVAGAGESAQATKAFYEEYRSVCDLPAEFYLQTVETVFQKHLLPKGKMMHRDKPVDPKKIHKTALLAIEGERDDISGLGQTKAALTIAKRLPEDKKRYYMVPKVGHYGIFNGRRWREDIAPVVETFIRENQSS